MFSKVIHFKTRILKDDYFGYIIEQEDTFKVYFKTKKIITVNWSWKNKLKVHIVRFETLFI